MPPVLPRYRTRAVNDASSLDVSASQSCARAGAFALLLSLAVVSLCPQWLKHRDESALGEYVMLRLDLMLRLEDLAKDQYWTAYKGKTEDAELRLLGQLLDVQAALPLPRAPDQQPASSIAQQSKSALQIQAPRSERAARFAKSLEPTLRVFVNHGLSQRAMLDQLQRLGVKTAFGQPTWHPAQLRRVLRRLGLCQRKVGPEVGPERKTLESRGLQDCEMLPNYLKERWSPRPESNWDLALRRHSFYPLNYGEVLQPTDAA